MRPRAPIPARACPALVLWALAAPAAVAVLPPGPASAGTGGLAATLQESAGERPVPADPGVPVDAGPLGDPDPAVRRAAVDAIGSTAAGSPDRDLAAEVGLLVRLADGDPDREVRAAAVAALGRVGGAEAGAALLERMAVGTAEEARAAASALAEAEGAADALVAAIRRLHRPAGDPRRIAPLPEDALAALLEAYGPALVEVGAVGPEARAPLVLARRSPSVRVRAAATAALDTALSRFALRGWPPAAEDFLVGLEHDGFDVRELRFRQAVLALSSGDAPEGALAPAARLTRAAVAAEAFEALDWGWRGHYVSALAHLARRRFEAVGPELDLAESYLRELRARRLELREPPESEQDTADARVAAELIVLQGLVAWTRLLSEVADGLDPGGERALELAATVHRRLLEAERLQLALDVPRWADSFDAVLSRNEGPRRVLLSNPALPDWTTAELLDVRRRALGSLAAVAPEEFPGIAPAVEDGAAGWEQDPVRRALVLSLRRAELALVARRMTTDRVNRMVWARAEGQLVERLREDQDTDGRSAYVDYRSPSSAALELARDLRGDGDPAASLEVAERLRADLERAELTPNGLGNDEFAALAGRQVGAALTDLDRPREAERELLDALERLEAIDNTLVERLDEARAGRVGAFLLTRRDPALVRALEARRDRNRRLRADVLTALAVNANVRLEDGERALAYFERAYALEATTFARVLLACYRARAGLDREARFLLADVEPTPDLYYNLACTWALLGERERALEFLALELRSPRLSDGARARQREWAADDPDLAALRGDPRFEALVAGDGER